MVTRSLAPPVCVLCGGTGQQLGEVWGLDLCEHCEAACQRLRGRCPRCAASPSPAGLPCTACLAAPGPFDAVHALFLYEPPVDTLISQLKFTHRLAPARVLGMVMARVAAAESWRRAGRDRPECIVPLPLHRRRYRERGFNQAAEIARHLAPRLGLPVQTRLLERGVDTAAQSGLTAEQRTHNVQQAFRLRRGCRVPARVVLLDDVMTTGHTVAAASRVLKEGGCRRVDVWVCARALRHDSPGVC